MEGNSPLVKNVMLLNLCRLACLVSCRGTQWNVQKGAGRVYLFPVFSHSEIFILELLLCGRSLVVSLEEKTITHTWLLPSESLKEEKQTKNDNWELQVISLVSQHT